eukprot:scaffold756_cov281-Pinguiococcus_pyrenoidosus.AAC.4
MLVGFDRMLCRLLPAHRGLGRALSRVELAVARTDQVTTLRPFLRESAAPVIQPQQRAAALIGPEELSASRRRSGGFPRGDFEN